MMRFVIIGFLILVGLFGIAAIRAGYKREITKDKFGGMSIVVIVILVIGFLLYHW